MNKIWKPILILMMINLMDGRTVETTQDQDYPPYQQEEEIHDDQVQEQNQKKHKERILAASSNQPNLKCYPIDPYFPPTPPFYTVQEVFSKQMLKTPIFRRYYSLQERLYRLRVAQQNLKLINEHNRNKSRTYNMKPNQFIILKYEEFQAINLNLKVPRKIQISSIRSQSRPGRRTLIPEASVNHQCRSGNPSHQGLCGSCYAMAASDTAAILMALSTNGNYQRLSAQQIVSKMHNGGCQGGYLSQALQYIAQEGLFRENHFQYENAYSSTTADQAEASAPSSSKIKIFGSVKKISYGNCVQLIQVLHSKPVAVAVAFPPQTRFYSQGTIKSALSNVINHGVVLVGYHEEYGYWVKNSWGINWGDGGYGLIDLVQNGGICQYAVTLKAPYPKAEFICPC